MVAGLGDCYVSVDAGHGTVSARDFKSVVDSARFMGLRGVRLRSDRQPSGLFVQNVVVRPGEWAPMVVAAARLDRAAWIKVTVDGTHWARLAYQFGHELGHVLCNSWGAGCEPRAPCQWVEEACVEAFSIRGLWNMAERWAAKPPYPSWKAYAPEFEAYAAARLLDHSGAREAVSDGVSAEARRAALGCLLTLGDAARAMVPDVALAFRAGPRLLDDLGALNRWPERSGLRFDPYVAAWEASCSELGTPGKLPRLIADLLP